MNWPCTLGLAYMLAIYVTTWIYIGDGIGHKVIHLARGEDPIVPSSSLSSHSLPSDSSINTGANQSMSLHCHVEYCSIDSFLDGGELNIYKYGVNHAFLLAKIRGGTCTRIPADPPKYVANQARFLQYCNCFGAYNLFSTTTVKTLRYIAKRFSYCRKTSLILARLGRQHLFMLSILLSLLLFPYCCR